jgi:hypothetical protein
MFVNFMNYPGEGKAREAALLDNSKQSAARYARNVHVASAPASPGDRSGADAAAAPCDAVVPPRGSPYSTRVVQGAAL